jgi:2-polyprenyl-3-methyl-5-hydroxy-6-metoxy-1,4-benzoquinol methylase
MQQNQAVQYETSQMPCNLCSNSDVLVLATHSRRGAPLRTVICNKCGLVWSDPFPHDPRHFYEEDYRVEYKNTYSPKPKHILRAGMVALTRHNKIKHLLNGRKTILDVGTGGGEFAYLLKSLGHDLHGIEPNKGYGEYSAAEYGLNLQLGFIQDSQFSNDSFDVITIWHVLEHTEDPCFVLGKLRSLLKAQGVLVVEVPNIEAICQSPKSTFHEAHLFNFNLDTLRKMGEKAGLVEDSHLFSDDAGNVTMFFRKAPSDPMKAGDWVIAGNADRITAVVQAHSNVKHYLTAAPYLRFLRRMFRAVSERNTVKGGASNKSLLDRLYQKCKSS